jgi:hypothetical protein
MVNVVMPIRQAETLQVIKPLANIGATMAMKNAAQSSGSGSA